MKTSKSQIKPWVSNIKPMKNSNIHGETKDSNVKSSKIQGESNNSKMKTSKIHGETKDSNVKSSKIKGEKNLKKT